MRAVVVAVALLLGLSAPVVAQSGITRAVDDVVAGDDASGLCDEVGWNVVWSEQDGETSLDQAEMERFYACEAGIDFTATCIDPHGWQPGERPAEVEPPAGMAWIECFVGIFNFTPQDLRIELDDLALVQGGGMRVGVDPRVVEYQRDAMYPVLEDQLLPSGQYVYLMTGFAAPADVAMPFLVQYSPALPNGTRPMLTVVVDRADTLSEIGRATGFAQ